MESYSFTNMAHNRIRSSQGTDEDQKISSGITNKESFTLVMVPPICDEDYTSSSSSDESTAKTDATSMDNSTSGKNKMESISEPKTSSVSLLRRKRLKADCGSHEDGRIKKTASKKSKEKSTICLRVCKVHIKRCFIEESGESSSCGYSLGVGHCPNCSINITEYLSQQGLNAIFVFNQSKDMDK